MQVISGTSRDETPNVATVKHANDAGRTVPKESGPGIRENATPTEQNTPARADEGRSPLTFGHVRRAGRMSCAEVEPGSHSKNERSDVLLRAPCMRMETTAFPYVCLRYFNTSQYVIPLAHVLSLA